MSSDDGAIQVPCEKREGLWAVIDYLHVVAALGIMTTREWNSVYSLMVQDIYGDE